MRHATDHYPPLSHRLAALLTVVALVMAACSGGGTFDDEAAEADADGGASPGEDAGATDAAPAAAGTLAIATSADILTMDPAMHRDRITQAVIRNVFDALVNQDAELAPVPELAESWEAVDETTWRFHLREDVTFSNGEPFDAEDVKFSIERILDPEQASPRASMLEMISEVEIEDDRTVVIRTDEPSPTLLAGLAVNEIVPSEYVTEVGDEAFAAEPIGTGPFTFAEWVPNQRVVLEANPDHWEGAPRVDTVEFRPVPEVAARVAALQSGDVHIASEIPPDLAGTLGGDVKAVPVDGTRVFFLAMNTTQPPFDNRDVRVGVNHAIDRDALVDDLLGGYARVLYQPLFPEVIGYSVDYEGYTFDPEQAASMLEGASAPVRIDVEERDRTLAEAVAGQLQAAGLDAQINVLETEAFTASIESGDSQAYVQSWGVAEGDADVIFARHFWSPVREEAFYTGYKNPELDSLIETGRSTVNEEERIGVYADAVEMVMADAPWAPLLNAQEIYGISERVEGFEPSPIGRYELVDVKLDS